MRCRAAQDPSRKDIAWKLGVDADTMLEDVRQVTSRTRFAPKS